MQYSYVMKGLGKAFPGGKQVLKDIWLSFIPGAKIGIIGSNGSGKTTLMKIMGGTDQDFTGEAWAAKGIRVGYLPQEPELDSSKNVYENILDSLAYEKGLLDEFNEVSAKFLEPMSDDEMNDLLEKQGRLQEEIDALDAWNLENRIEVAMTALGCPPKDAKVDDISGGEKRRVALTKLLLEEPDILLLDEPTNHLDAYSVNWLERYLQEYKGTVVLVTHDRYFLDNVVSWILELDRGQGIPHEGNYSSWLEAKAKRLKTEQKSEDAQAKKMQQELEWIKQTPKGRQTKSKSRITAFEKLNDNFNDRISEGSIVIPEGPRLGENVIKVQKISKGYDGRILFEDLNFDIPKGAIVGVIGANGMGKSTFLRIVTGQETADNGGVSIGDTAKLSYVDQLRTDLRGENTVWEEISDKNDEIDLGKKSINSRAYCSWFNFKGADQQKKMHQLSGGERNRVHLAKLLKSGGNVIILDEPTNDLDIATLRSLEEALLNFQGCIIVVSHDRFFLDRIATHMLAFEGDGNVVWHEGNFQSYEEDRKRRLGIEENEQERFKFRKFKH